MKKTKKGKRKNPRQNTNELTPKQAAFVREYVIDSNGKQAAIRAGYSPKTAEAQASRLLRNVKVQAALAQLTKEIEEKSKLSVEYVLEGLQRVTERCQTVVPVMEKVDGKWEPTGEFKFDSSGANKSLELIGRHFKMFTDKIEHSGDFVVVMRDYSKEGEKK